MEEVPGIPGLVPPLALYPESGVRASLPPAEWEACLDSWLSSVEWRLRLEDKVFANFRLSQNASGVDFLTSFFRLSESNDSAMSKPQKERLLLKRAYLLLRRLLLVTTIPTDYDSDKLLELLGLASLHYASVKDWKLTLASVWKRSWQVLNGALESWKKSAIRELSTPQPPARLLESYRRINALVRVSADAGLVLMTGTDYLETVQEAYNTQQTQQSLPSVLTEHIFYCLRSLMSDGSSHGSLLLDHLYFMKSEAERMAKSSPTRPTLCSSLVCTTSFLRHLAADNSVASGQRGRGLLDFLSTYRQNTSHLHPPTTAKRRRKSAKGKGRAGAMDDMHMHKASEISQVHELFPSLSTPYILKLLDHFHDDPEAVVAGLLEPDSLPSDLKDSDSHEAPSSEGLTYDLAPRGTPPLPTRKNVFDGDDFDTLQISSNRLHRGRKDIDLGDGRTDERTQRKAAIMSALAAFDSDDDERDDTYDVADVGGTVDSTLDTDDRLRPEGGLGQTPHEEVLYKAWKDSPDLFARDTQTRISKVRQDLKRQTDLSDEQIEGWAIMLKKDPKIQQRLDAKYGGTQTFRGNQGALASTKWQGGEDDDEDDEATGSGSHRGGRGGHTRAARGGRGRGGSTAGPSGDTATQAARRRKEQGKGRGGASHNRREGRARKMDRGMAGPAAS